MSWFEPLSAASFPCLCHKPFYWAAYFHRRRDGTELDDLLLEFSIPLSVMKAGMCKYDATDFPNAGSTIGYAPVSPPSTHHPEIRDFPRFPS